MYQGGIAQAGFGATPTPVNPGMMAGNFHPAAMQGNIFSSPMFPANGPTHPAGIPPTGAAPMAQVTLCPQSFVFYLSYILNCVFVVAVVAAVGRTQFRPFARRPAQSNDAWSSFSTWYYKVKVKIRATIVLMMTFLHEGMMMNHASPMQMAGMPAQMSNPMNPYAYPSAGQQQPPASMSTNLWQ